MRAAYLFMTRRGISRNPMLWIWILAGLAAGGFALLCGLVVLDGKRDAERQADMAAGNMTQTIEQDIARTFELLDLSLQGVIRGLQEPEFSALRGEARQLALFDYEANATYLNAILVLDETGAIVEDSQSLVPPKLNFADSDFFRIQRDHDDVGMFLSQPLKSPWQEGEWMIALSRRISKPDGSFGGVVVGTVQVDYFQSLFANLSLGHQGTITLFHSDGLLVTRQPFHLQEIAKDFKNTTLFRHYPAESTGHFDSSNTEDGVSRRFTFVRIRNLPLVISVGFAIADIYAPWRQKELFGGALMAGLILTIVALLILLSREFAGRRRADALSRESEAKYRLLTDNSSDGIILRDRDGRRRYATPAYYAILGRSLDEIGDKRLNDFLDEESREAQRDTVKRLRAGEQKVIVLLQYSHPDGTRKWLESTSSAIADESGTITEIVTNLRDVTLRKATEDALAAAATTDAMTGIANRRSFDAALANEWKRAIRSRSNIALLMIDVDFFKAYNDTLGHLRGDDALKLVATCINSNIRSPNDFGARYGGEEFAVILSGADTCGALAAAEKLRRSVLALALPQPASPIGAVTISIGMTSMQPKPGDDDTSLIRTADAALYQAKQNGRNRTEQSVPDAQWDPVQLSA